VRASLFLRNFLSGGVAAEDSRGGYVPDFTTHQGLTALSPPKRGFGCDFLTPRASPCGRCAKNLLKIENNRDTSTNLAETAPSHEHRLPSPQRGRGAGG
jgi:hypothetical protein